MDTDQQSCHPAKQSCHPAKQSCNPAEQSCHPERSEGSSLPGPDTNQPCRICGASPVRKSATIKRLGITISLMVYPCDCFDKQEEENNKKEKWARQLAKAKIPPRYWDATLDPTGFSPHEKKILPICQEFISQVSSQPSQHGHYHSQSHIGHAHGKQPSQSPIGTILGRGFIGDVGVGKTYYLCAILLQLLRNDKQCLFLSMPEYYDSLKASFSSGSSGYESESGPSAYEDITGQAKDIYIVAFDDIGAEYNSQWAVDELGKIINHRYNYGLPILFSSNLRTDELARRIGARSVDRLKEMCRCFLLEGKSLRGKKS